MVIHMKSTRGGKSAIEGDSIPFLYKAWNNIPDSYLKDIVYVSIDFENGKEPLVFTERSSVREYFRRELRSLQIDTYTLHRLDDSGEEVYNVSGTSQEILNHFNAKFRTWLKASGSVKLTRFNTDEPLVTGIQKMGQWLHLVAELPDFDIYAPEPKPQPKESRRHEPKNNNVVCIDINDVISNIEGLIVGAPNEAQIRQLLAVLNYAITK